jgi:type IV pilus assembly protein PilV
VKRIIKNQRPPLALPAKQRGFTLIEVMIAVLILAFGLLGFALLQTMNVRFTNSANQRSQATNLAYEMLDQMRVNRLAAVQYAGDYEGTADGCDPGETVNAAAFRTTWECRLQYALGPGASAEVTYAGGVASVAVTWGDARWEEDVDDRNQTFTLVTQL